MGRAIHCPWLNHWHERSSQVCSIQKNSCCWKRYTLTARRTLSIYGEANSIARGTHLSWLRYYIILQYAWLSHGGAPYWLEWHQKVFALIRHSRFHTMKDTQKQKAILYTQKNIKKNIFFFFLVCDDLFSLPKACKNQNHRRARPDQITKRAVGHLFFWTGLPCLYSAAGKSKHQEPKYWHQKYCIRRLVHMVNELSLQNRPSGKEQPIHQRIVQIDKLIHRNQQ